jgi:uric acid transporter
VFVLNLVFNHLLPNFPRKEGALEAAVDAGAVSPDEEGTPQRTEA